jgi:hypothetical protein
MSPHETHPAIDSVSLQFSSFADYIFYFRQIVLLLRWREWDCRVQSRDADDGAVKIIEGFLVKDCADLAG